MLMCMTILYFLRNDAFVGRTYLAVIDHNTHVFRKAAVTAKGKQKYNKVYSKFKIKELKDCNGQGI